MKESVLLINTPLSEFPQRECEESLPPLGLGYIATELRKKKINTELLDALAEHKSIQEIITQIEEQDYTHVGMNIFSTNAHLVKKIMQSIKRELIFILGGAYTKSQSQNIIKWEVKNPIQIIAGEGELIIPDLIQNKVKIKPLNVHQNKSFFFISKFSEYFPHDINNLTIDREIFKNEPTLNPLTNEPEANIVASRDCIYDCKFCGAAISSNQSSHVRIRSLESLHEEIFYLKNHYPNLKSIRILDDLFLRDKVSILRAIELFSSHNLHWRAMAHIQSFKHINQTILFDMKNSGCLELSIGIESGNDQILKYIKKNNSVREIYTVLEKLFKAGIYVKGYFIVGFPGETFNQMQDTLNLATKLVELAKQHGTGFRVSSFQFRPYHGTQLYKELTDKNITIEQIHSTNLGQYSRKDVDFSSGNYSNVDDITLNNFISQLRSLNV